MALPLAPGMTPAEVAFLCEMELVTVVPRQRLDAIRLLGGETPILRPPHRAVLPLWLALLLKRQRRANIVAPPWLHPLSLQELVMLETRGVEDGGGGAGVVAGAVGGTGSSPVYFVPFSAPPPPPARADGRGGRRAVSSSYPFGSTNTPLSPPFLPSCTADSPAGYLPYHWFEVAEILVAHAPDDLPAPVGEIRALLRDLAEARAAKARALTALAALAPAALPVRGIGAMELAESRRLWTAVHDGARRLGAATEASRREEEAAGGGGSGGGAGDAAGGQYDDDDDDDDNMF